MAVSGKLVVEVWSDVICPFCYIGKRHLELAIASLPHPELVDVRWRSFQLDEQAPVDFNMGLVELLARKYRMSVKTAEERSQGIAARAAEVGLVFNYRNAIPTNTYDAHRILHLAAAHGLQDRAKERLLLAYFTEGRHVGRKETLRQLGKEVGLPVDELEAVLEGDAFQEEVKRDIAEAQRMGVSGVPFFLVDGKHTISGAQPVDVFRSTLTKAWGSRNQGG